MLPVSCEASVLPGNTLRQEIIGRKCATAPSRCKPATFYGFRDIKHDTSYTHERQGVRTLQQTRNRASLVVGTNELCQAISEFSEFLLFTAWYHAGRKIAGRKMDSDLY